MLEIKEEAPDRTVWRTRCERECGHVVRHTAEWMRSTALVGLGLLK